MTKEISLEESKNIQIDILSAIDCFCADNDIVYSLSCGTLLGAVRHKGFIPWDDDIDICMLRKDYERFITLFPNDLDDKYNIACYERFPQWHLGYAKVYDSRTICIDKNAKTMPVGVGVDVFPMDIVPDSDVMWNSFRSILASQRTKISIKIMRYGVVGLWQKIALLIKKVQICNVPLSRCVSDYITTAQLYNDSSYNRVFECVLGISSKNPFPKSLFDDIVDWTFENKIFKGFRNASVYLSATFGDFMTLPPEEKRVPKHNYRQYWK